MTVDCYSMDLYCDNPKCDRRESLMNLPYSFPDSFTGRNRRDCVTQATRNGWAVRARVAICPHCAAIGIKPTKKFEDGWWNRAGR